ncbi:MAG: Eco57I restriction-modification methylase domain-containing protein [Phycisphaerales bacterium JB054]
MTTRLFEDLAPNAVRPPRSDRLLLPRHVKPFATSKKLPDEEVDAAHAVLVRWADLEASGKLARMNESQVEGDFVREVFGDALGYKRRTEGLEAWHLEVKASYGQAIPDVSLGRFRAASTVAPSAVVELKGPKKHLDRDRSNGRTAVQQCWDYLADLPETRWGIVSNIVSFRLYERSHTKRRFEHYALQDLRDKATFRRFYATFARRSLLDRTLGHPPITEEMLDATDKRQRTVGDELYKAYSRERHELIDHLLRDHGLSLDEAVEAAQRVMDRILFIAFCEDRKLLPENTLDRAFREVPPFTKATNPRWQNYIQLFRAVDGGSADGTISAYNGGLFAPSRVDELDLDDRWTGFFRSVGTYDFADEINLDVLGHLFEKSITELEKLRQGDLFGEGSDADAYAAMPQSARRKRMGVYYTPPAFTTAINELAVDALLTERFEGVARAMGLDATTADSPEFWRGCLSVLGSFRVVDPACGSGAFLFQAYEVLEARYLEVLGHLERLRQDVSEEVDAVPDRILAENIYGVDLSAEAVEITQLALWIRTARPGHKLTDLAHNIRCGNSLVDDPAVDPRAFDWHAQFPEVFGEGGPGGFDAVVGNPPWERIKVQEREFFSLSAPKIATASNAAKRRTLIAALAKKNPPLYTLYEAALAKADALGRHCRHGDDYPLTGKGDINTYIVFAELAMRLVSPEGRVGLLVPSGIATDNTSKEFFAALTDSKRLRCLYDFENKKRVFPDVDGRFKFSIVCFGGETHTADEADYVFFAREIEELADPKRHIKLSAADIALVNPNTKTCPIFRTRRDAELTKAVYRRVPVLLRRDRKTVTNDWGVSFLRMFDQTNDAELFAEPGDLKAKRYRLEGNRFVKGKKVYLPVYEAKMIQAYDHRACDVIAADHNWVRQNQKEETTDSQHGDLGHLSMPRWWATREAVLEAVGESAEPAFLCYKDVTSSTNTRTMIASFVPVSAVVNSAPILRFDASIDLRLRCCLLGNLNSFAYDFIARQKVGSTHLNYFIVEQLPTIPPHEYAQRCPWDNRCTLATWISERVLKLSCTASDMLPLAEAAKFKGGDAEGGKLNHWKAQERADLLAELDAAYLHLYGLSRDDAEYVLSTFKIAGQSHPGLPGTRTLGERVLDEYDHLAQRSV